MEEKLLVPSAVRTEFIKSRRLLSAAQSRFWWGRVKASNIFWSSLKTRQRKPSLGFSASPLDRFSWLELQAEHPFTGHYIGQMHHSKHLLAKSMIRVSLF